MRILRTILSTFLFFAVISCIIFFLLRELLLYWGVSKIRSSLRELSLASNRGSYSSQCMQLGSRVIQGETLVTYQIRFISSSEYIVEAVCEGFSFDPITISQHTLPQFVTKMPGSSGFLMSMQQSGIELEVFAPEISKITQSTGIDVSFLSRRKPIVSENGVLLKDSTLGVVGNGPVTICAGYGYECCNEVSHFGVGDRITGLPDCESSCYSSCATRPVLLSLNTNPLLDQQTRSIEIVSGSPVEFTYVADFGNSTAMNGIIDFGDGKKMPISGLAGQTSHTYDCFSVRCEYSATITLEDNWGVKSAQLETSKVKIIVTGR